MESSLIKRAVIIALVDMSKFLGTALAIFLYFFCTWIFTAPFVLDIFIFEFTTKEDKIAMFIFLSCILQPAAFFILKAYIIGLVERSREYDIPSDSDKGFGS